MDLNTIKIKGKDYVLINERIKAFRSLPQYKDWSIETDIRLQSSDECLVRCEIKNSIGELKATGHAYEVKGSTYINKDSHIENCETSAIGRALGILGIGIDNSVASYEEVANVEVRNKKPITQNVSIAPQEIIDKVTDTIRHLNTIDEVVEAFDLFSKERKKYPSLTNIFTLKKQEINGRK